MDEKVAPETVSIPSALCFSSIFGCIFLHALLKKLLVSEFVFVISVIFPSFTVNVIVTIPEYPRAEAEYTPSFSVGTSGLKGVSVGAGVMVICGSDGVSAGVGVTCGCDGVSVLSLSGVLVGCGVTTPPDSFFAWERAFETASKIPFEE